MPQAKGTGSATTRRPSVREAFNTTVTHCGVDVRQLSQRVESSYTAISQFQNNEREITTRTLDGVLTGLSTTEFLYFLGVMEQGETPKSSCPSSSVNLDTCELVQHPAFCALVAHIMKNCDSRQFHELFCILSDAYSNSSGIEHVKQHNRLASGADLSYCPAQVGIREALNATLDGFNVKLANLARLSQVPDSVLSQYRSSDRELRTNTLDRVLQALSAEQYRFFTQVFRDAISLLKAAEPAFGDTQQDDYACQFEAFGVLLAQASRQCTEKQYEALFCLMNESRRAARKLSD